MPYTKDDTDLSSCFLSVAITTDYAYIAMATKTITLFFSLVDKSATYPPNLSYIIWRMMHKLVNPAL
jgi:hypothetical protein